MFWLRASPALAGKMLTRAALTPRLDWGWEVRIQGGFLTVLASYAAWWQEASVPGLQFLASSPEDCLSAHTTWFPPEQVSQETACGKPLGLL